MNLLTPLAQRLYMHVMNVFVTITRYAPTWQAPAMLRAFNLARRRLNSTTRKLDILLAKFLAGQLRPIRARAPRPKPETPRPRPEYVYTGPLWLVKQLHMTSLLAPALEQDILPDPQMQALIAAEPRRAGRLLRPLACMVGAQLPASLILPKRPRKPRPPKPKPEPLPPTRHRYPAPGQKMLPLGPNDVPLKFRLQIPGVTTPLRRKNRL